ncbi:hypothetical protein OIU79_001330 [Salix purpurea]|uniref:Uncharacterized protein n=1 Tax=Salix purpurea TaxID=77065 RepID=A0A9Q0NI03_SALPP|nr:hypothetical protein OIU79_001330 [Salix purpurea]
MLLDYYYFYSFFCQRFIFIRFRSEILIYIGDNFKINIALFFPLFFFFCVFSVILSIFRIK